MDALTIIAIVLIVVLVVLWIFYNRYTNRIIEELLAENTALVRDLDKLQKELSKEREIKGEAFMPMTFTATTKPLTPELQDTWSKILGKEKAEIIAVIEPVDFPNSEVNHNEN